MSAAVPRTFVVHTADAALEVTEWGAGDLVMLVSGWPQTQYAWRKLVPLLVDAAHRVVVVEPRGLGRSTTQHLPADLSPAIDDLLIVAQRFTSDPFHLVGHDIGAWLAHGLAAREPAAVRSLVLVDAGIPGLTPPPSGNLDEGANARSWHFGFNRLPDLPELLLAGRERSFLDWLLRSKSADHAWITDEVVEEYAEALAAPGAVTAGMDYYRAVFSALGQRAAAIRGARSINVPTHVVSGRRGVAETLQRALENRSARLSGVVLEDCGHYVAEERPEALFREMLSFWRRLDDARAPESDLVIDHRSISHHRVDDLDCG
ncbi:alpha/beta hydrolase [Microbacterium yannicii]|uniref:alpha/beta hydrolase n=1 Tax=Microbacterium yannicii TaxID=671622 RepID=UPI0009FFD181|nr:alpha/beta hydrolase [Microbacterium yannicii]